MNKDSRKLCKYESYLLSIRYTKKDQNEPLEKPYTFAIRSSQPANPKLQKSMPLQTQITERKRSTTAQHWL